MRSSRITIGEHIRELHRELDATKLAITSRKHTIDALAGLETLIAHQTHVLSQQIENLRLANGMIPLNALSPST